MAHADDTQAAELLEPLIHAILLRAGRERFSTKRVIDALRSRPEGEQAYQSALDSVSQSQHGSDMARHIVHGQVIPDILRRSLLVRFAGFIHGRPDEDDGYAVPSWWQPTQR